MAISFVQGTSGGAANGANVSLTLTSLQQNDLVVYVAVIGDSDNVDFDIAMSTAGYTEVADLFSNDTVDCNLAVFYKFMTATPDTTAIVVGQGGTNAGVGAALQVFRGVALVADGGPFDASATTATGIDTMHPNPPSITPVSNGAWTVIAGGSGHTLNAQTYTFPTGYTTNAQNGTGNDTNDGTAGIGYNPNPARPEDPGVMTLSGADSTSFAWCAVTMALKPADVPDSPVYQPGMNRALLVR